MKTPAYAGVPCQRMPACSEQASRAWVAGNADKLFKNVQQKTAALQESWVSAAITAFQRTQVVSGGYC